MELREQVTWVGTLPQRMAAVLLWGGRNALVLASLDCWLHSLFLRWWCPEV